MTRHVVASFWVYRPRDFPNAAPYCDMLKMLDASCKRFGFDHVVLTDNRTSPFVEDAGLHPFLVDLPRDLMQAISISKALWLASPYSKDTHSIFVGADCLVLRDFRADLPTCDLAIGYMRANKKWRLNNGIVYVPTAAREKVLSLFELIAADTRPRMCDDMLAFERALVPMPKEFGTFQRRGLSVAFLPMGIWNYCPKRAEDSSSDAAILHAMGGWDDGKKLFFDWAREHSFA